MAQPRPTLRDVAERAGLSIGAVSQILNQRGNFPADTRQRTIEIAAAIGYKPNPLGRSLASGRSHLLAVYFSQPSHARHFMERDYIRQVYLTASQEAIDRGYTLILGPPSPENVIWNRIPVEGVLLVSPRKTDAVADLLCSLGVPVVVLGRDPVGRTVQAEVDYDVPTATKELLDHLESQGAKNISYIGAQLDDSFAADVEDAYSAWCTSRSQPPNVLRTSGTQGRQATVRTLLSGSRPDGVLCDVWEAGQEVVHEATTLGINVPDELLVATFGDSDPRHGEVDVTSVLLLPEAAAVRGLQVLVELVEGKPLGPPTFLTHRLQAGRSTARSTVTPNAT